MSSTLLAEENHQIQQASYGSRTYAVELRLDQISRDGDTQSRAEINHSVVEEYAEAFREGATFPPVTVYYDGKFYWLADGFHRVQATEAAGMRRIAADIRQGTRRDAVLHSVGANACHGLRRTNADKQRAVETLLRDEEWGQWSDNAIAKACGVSQPFVGKMRAKSLSYNRYKIERTVQRQGTIYTQNTTKIGKERVIQGTASVQTQKAQRQLPPEPVEPQDLVREPKSKDKQLLPSIQPNPDVPPDEPAPASASLVNTAALTNGKPDVVATEIAIGVRHLTPEQLAWVISSAASNGLSDSHLNAVIKAAEQALGERRYPEDLRTRNAIAAGEN